MSNEIKDRIIFCNGQQRTFLLTAKKQLNMNWEEMGKLTKTHRRSFSDWVNEKYNMPLPVAQILSKRCNLAIPQNIQTKRWKDHLQTISASGGESSDEKIWQGTNQSEILPTKMERVVGKNRKIPIPPNYKQTTTS